MKPLVFLLMLLALPGTAQQPEIIRFDTDDMVTWINPDTNAFFSTDWTWNLNYNWVQIDSRSRATQTLMHTSMWDLQDLPPGLPPDFPIIFRELRAQARSAGDTTDALFVRIRTSIDWLECGIVTNWLRVCNTSTSVLENLTFGVESGLGNRSARWTVDVPSLAPQSNTVFHAMSFSWPVILSVFPGESTPVRYFIAYAQDGEQHDLADAWVMPSGPPRKEISFVVSNSSCTVDFEWLPGGVTTKY